MLQNTYSADFFTLLTKTFDPPPTFLLNIWYEILGLYEAFVRLLRILHFAFWGIPKADVT